MKLWAFIKRHVAREGKFAPVKEIRLGNNGVGNFLANFLKLYRN